MDKAFWQERWQRRDIGFHQLQIHEQLKRLWPSLNLARGSTVFVPLAGKSRDMVWLATQGHRVIGVELSDIAVREFFEEGGETPKRTLAGKLRNLLRRSIQHILRRLFRAAGRGVAGRRCCLRSCRADCAATRHAAALCRYPCAHCPARRRHFPHRRRLSGAGDHRPAVLPFHRRRDRAGFLASAFEIAVLEARDGLAASDNLKKRGVTRLEETVYLLRRRA